MNKFLPFFIFIIYSSLNCIAQNSQLFDVLDSDKYKFEINWSKKIKYLENEKDSNKVYLIGVIVDPTFYNDEFEKTGKINESWLSYFDLNKFVAEFFVAHPKNAAKDFKLVFPNKVEEPLKRSTLFIIVQNPQIRNFLENNSEYLSLNICKDCNSEKSSTKKETIFQLINITNSKDFEWKVNQLIFNLSNLKLEEPEKKKDELKNSFQINFNQSLFAYQNWKSDLSDLIYSKANINSVDFNFNIKINKKVNVLYGASLVNLRSGVSSEKISYSFVDYTSQGLSINRINTINNFSETWNASNCLALHTGLNISIIKSKNEKFNISSTFSFGKFLPIMARTDVKSGTFNYEAKLDGINDTLRNIQSLGLLSNVQYANGLNETIHFSGSKFHAQLNASYNFNSVFYLQGLMSFSVVQLRNVNYKANLPISQSFGDFNSSFNNVKSMTLLPFSIGLGVGIKF